MPKVGIMHSGTYDKVSDYINKFKAAVETHIVGPVDWVDVHDQNYGHNGRKPLRAIAQGLIANGTIDLVAALGGAEVMREALGANNPHGKSIVVCCPSDKQITNHKSYSTGVHAKTSSLENERLRILLRDAGVQPGDTIGVLLKGTRNDKADINRDLQAVVDNWNGNHNPANPVTLDPRDITPGASDQASVNSIAAEFERWRTIGNTSGYQGPGINSPSHGARCALVTSDPVFHDLRAEIVRAAQNRVRRTIYQWRDFVDAGGWMSHGASLLNCYETAGHMAGRLLTGIPITDAVNRPYTEPAMTGYCPGWPN